MFKFLLVAAFAVAQLISVPVALARPTVDISHIEDEMAFACSVLQYDCTNVPLPPIVTAPLFFEHGAFGQYNGQTLVIDSQIMPIVDTVLRDSIIAHELAHYLDHVFQGDAMFYDWNALCATEWNGWRVGNAYVVSHGRPDFADFNWQQRYGCYQ